MHVHLDSNMESNPWELAWEVANSHTQVTEYLELAHMHKGEVIGKSLAIFCAKKEG